MGNSICNCNNKQEQDEVGLRGIDSYTSGEFKNDLFFLDEINGNKSKKSMENTQNLLSQYKDPGYEINNNMTLYLGFLKLQRRIKKFLKLKKKRQTNNNDTISKSENKRSLGGRDHNFDYYGEYENEKKHGFGIQVWKDGAIYKGYFVDDKANYFGWFQHSDGEIFTGEFKENKACGYGIYTHSNGASCEGMWLNDIQNGVGIEIWTDNSKYEGFYVNGKKDGFGSYIWADGSSYIGEWIENTLNGYVELYKI